MAHLKVNLFASWELSEEEEIQGKMLTTAQLMVVQNYIAEAAAEKLLLDPGSTKKELKVFTKTEAALAARIAAYQYIIDESACIEDNQRYVAEAAIAAATLDPAIRSTPVMEIFATSSVVVEPEELNTEDPAYLDTPDPSELPPQSTT